MNSIYLQLYNHMYFKNFWDQEKFYFFETLDNITATVGNVSHVIEDCYRMQDEGREGFQIEIETKYGSYNNFYLAGLQNLGGLMLYFNPIMEKITDAEITCEFDVMAYYYGKLLKMIFDFEPVETGSFGNVSPVPKGLF